jgi:hypothetical protein
MARGRRFKNPNLEGPLDSKTVIHENQLEEGQNKAKVGVTDTQTLKTCFYNHDLVTQRNRWDRKLEHNAMFQICGGQEEDGHHAVVACTKAKALVRGFCSLPDESQFQNTGPDWLLLLLSKVDRTTGARIMLLSWRAWHLRNDVMHGRGTGSVLGSANFVVSYAESLQVGGQTMRPDPDTKGKGKLGEARSDGKPQRRTGRKRGAGSHQSEDGSR